MSEDVVMRGPRFVGAKARTMRIDFEWPIEFNGRVEDHVNLRRLTAGEVAEWMKEISSQVQSGLSLAWPVLRDDDDLPIPAGLTDALDADDFDAVNKAVLDFLPRRFRGALTNASARPTGAITN
jgi:hypothetical protein